MTKNNKMVRICKEVPVSEAISSMLIIDRTDANEIVSVGPQTGRKDTRLDYMRHNVFVRTDIGLINFVEGVRPGQIGIYPDTKRPVGSETTKDAAYQAWFAKHGNWFDKQVATLKDLCLKYPEYQKHFGHFFKQRRR